MRNTIRLTFLLTLIASGAMADATKSPNPLTSQSRDMYDAIKLLVLRSAEAMPEQHFGFKPTPAVRSFGQIIGHVADSQYYFCSLMLGEPYTSRKIEKSTSTKAELIAALKQAFNYCERAHASASDARATELVKLMGKDTPRLFVLVTNSVHSIEHYGNLATYLRMKDIVPPSSDPAFVAKYDPKK